MPSYNDVETMIAEHHQAVTMIAEHHQAVTMIAEHHQAAGNDAIGKWAMTCDFCF
jgi:hypothetical protein